MLPSFEKLIEGLRVLPGVGQRTATKLATDILRLPESSAQRLLASIELARTNICFCAECHGYSENERCGICESARDRSTLCVVKDPLDVWQLEKTGQFKGYYHVLGGVLSPVDGVGPQDIQLDSLAEKFKQYEIREVLFALPATAEAEATSHWIRRLAPEGAQCTNLAYGIPVGGSLEHLDERTLSFAIANRRDLSD